MRLDPRPMRGYDFGGARVPLCRHSLCVRSHPRQEAGDVYDFLRDCIVEPGSRGAFALTPTRRGKR